MKRTRTLISYFSPAVPEQQGDATGHGEQQPEANATPSPAPEQQNVQAPTLQSQELTTKAIVAEIGDRKFVVLVDEARDASIKEQMAVVLRFVDAQGQVTERFLGMKCVADTTSSSLKEALDGMFARHGLSMSRVRGQGLKGMMEHLI